MTYDDPSDPDRRRASSRAGDSADASSRWGVAPYSVADDYRPRSSEAALPASLDPRTSTGRGSKGSSDGGRAGRRSRSTSSAQARRVEDFEPVAARRQTGDPDVRELRAADQLGSRPRTVLAGFGGVILTVVTTGLGAILDILLSSSIGLATLLGLCLGAAVAALFTRKSDLISVIIAPPIVYTMYVVISLLVRSAPVSLTSLANAAVDGFPAIALATGIAALIAGLRLVTTRPNERP